MTAIDKVMKLVIAYGDVRELGEGSADALGEVESVLEEAFEEAREEGKDAVYDDMQDGWYGGGDPL
jgi:hypothetical protein